MVWVEVTNKGPQKAHYQKGIVMTEETLKTLACRVSPQVHAEFKALCCLKRKSVADILTDLVIVAVAEAKDRERQLIVEETLKAQGK